MVQNPAVFTWNCRWTKRIVAVANGRNMPMLKKILSIIFILASFNWNFTNSTVCMAINPENKTLPSRPTCII